MGKSQTTVDVTALYEEVVATSSNTGFIEVLLINLPTDVADQARALLNDGANRSNRNVGATLERLRVMFDIEVQPGNPGKKLNSEHVQRWRTSRGIQY